MKRTLLLVAMLLLSVKFFGQQLPAVLIKDATTGRKVAFNEIVGKGKVTLVTFWGTWCAHGKKEVRTIASKLLDWQKQADFNFIAIAAHEQQSERFVRIYADQQGWKFPCYTDVNADLGNTFDLRALPLTLIIDQNGKVIFSHTGYDNGKEIVSALMRICGHSNVKR